MIIKNKCIPSKIQIYTAIVNQVGRQTVPCLEDAQLQIWSIELQLPDLITTPPKHKLDALWTSSIGMVNIYTAFHMKLQTIHVSATMFGD